MKVNLALSLVPERFGNGCASRPPRRPLPLAMGCTRRYYRLSADREAIALIIIRSRRPTHAGDVEPQRLFDPRSRFYMPGTRIAVIAADDPDAHAYMLWVYKMRGAWKWRHSPEADGSSIPVGMRSCQTYVDFTSDGSSSSTWRRACGSRASTTSVISRISRSLPVGSRRRLRAFPL